MHFDWPINSGDFLSQNEQSVQVEKIIQRDSTEFQLQFANYKTWDAA